MNNHWIWTPLLWEVLDAASIHRKYNLNTNRIPNINIGSVGEPIKYGHANQGQWEPRKMEGPIHSKLITGLKTRNIKKNGSGGQARGTDQRHT